MDIKRTNLIEDVSVLTTLPKQTLIKLDKRKEDCFVHQILENYIDDKRVSCIDIGLGDIFVKVTEDGIEYKFQPSTSLENSLLTAIKTGESPIVREVDNSLLNKINQAYKDLF